jgi:hypothetical protein
MLKIATFAKPETVLVNAPKYLATTLNENKLENQSRIICLGIHSLNRELIYR